MSSQIDEKLDVCGQQFGDTKQGHEWWHAQALCTAHVVTHDMLTSGPSRTVSALEMWVTISFC